MSRSGGGIQSDSPCILGRIKVTMNQMPRTAVILANGPAVLSGVRVAPYPKLLLPIANHTLVEYQAALLASAGIDFLIIVLSADSAKTAKDLPSRLSRFPFEVNCVFQDTPRGTGGSLKEVEGLVRGDSFWVMSGDLLLDADLKQAAAFHFQSASTVTVGAVNVAEPPWEMERIETDGQDQVRAIHRVHPDYSRRSRLRPVGLYLFERTALSAIPQEGYFDIKEQLFSVLHSNSLTTRVWEIRTFCQNVSSFDRYIAANWEVLLRRTEFTDLKRWSVSESSGVSDFHVKGEPLLVPPVSLGSATTVDEGATLIGPTCISDRCTVEKDVVVNSCILLGGSKVEAGARITNCIVCADAVVERGADLRDIVVLPASGSEAGSVLFQGHRNGTSVRAEHVGVRAPSAVRERLRLQKRAFDVLSAACILLVAMPVMLFIAAAIKIDSPGPVIFRQRRCGQNGVEFTLYKFRSMVNNAEVVKREIQYLNEVDGPMFKIIQDPRTTRVGRFLRATNFDELPQLWNVLRGDISLVGPRPLSWDEMHFNPRWRDMRLSVPQGLIGLWQAKSHSKTSFADWIRYDTEYVFNATFWLDLKITMRTVINVVFDLLKSIVDLARKKG